MPEATFVLIEPPGEAELLRRLTGRGSETEESLKRRFAKARQEKPDLILLDVMMETETEGFHLAYKLREDKRYKDIPIIILTCIEEATGEILEPEKSGDFLPVDAFLRKPLDAKTLKGKVAEVLGSGSV